MDTRNKFFKIILVGLFVFFYSPAFAEEVNSNGNDKIGAQEVKEKINEDQSSDSNDKVILPDTSQNLFSKLINPFKPVELKKLGLRISKNMKIKSIQLWDGTKKLVSWKEIKKRRTSAGVKTGMFLFWQGNGKIFVTEPAKNNAASSLGPYFAGNLKMELAPTVTLLAGMGIGAASYNLDKVDTAGNVLTNPLEMNTFILPMDLSITLKLLPQYKVRPFVQLGSGLNYWRRKDITNDQIDMARYGDDTDGEKARGISLALLFSVGAEYSYNPNTSIDFSIDYRYISTKYDIFNAYPQKIGIQDTDGNGIFDANDEKQDIDGNGVLDDLDAMVNGIIQINFGVNYYFDLSGARDSDGDKIIDKYDKCPHIPEDKNGIEDSDGCPDEDKDKDGVPDYKDKCPGTPPDNTVDKNGCEDESKIDKDKDGIPDSRDKCIDEAEDKDGFEDGDGCPDIDNDGDKILDKNDKCPDHPEDMDGYEDEDGCPELDNDQDGVLDNKDKCANTPKGFKVDDSGCPTVEFKDKDGDGLEDSKDKCPTLKEDMDGFEDMDGCPDLDNDQDGFLDTVDECPNLAEDVDSFKDKDGCPDSDNDEDGIPDKDDKCPGTDQTLRDNIESKENRNDYKDDDGCPDKKPEEIKKGGKMILKGIKFVSGSADLLEESYPNLDLAFESLDAYPKVVVEIRGYTDNTGSKEINTKISQKRAESVMRYLVNRGVDPKRMTARGYGPNNPVASNNSEEGRAANRRIEFYRVK